MKPLVSVIIPIYKVERYIARCLHSVLSQDYTPMEVILVDDASPDRSVEIAQRIIDTEAKEGHTVRLLTHEHNCGLGAARRTAMEAVKGDWLLILDSDDWWDNTHVVSDWMQVALEGSHDVVIANYSLHYPNKDIFMEVPQLASGKDAAHSILCSLQESYVWNKLYAMQLFKPFIPCFEKGRNMWEDYYSVPRILYHATSVGYYKGCTVHYEQGNASSYTHRLSKQNIREMHAIIQSLAHYFLDKMGDQAFRDAIDRSLLNLKMQAYRSLPIRDFGKIRKAIPASVDRYIAVMPWSRLAKTKYRLMNQTLTAPLGKAIQWGISLTRRLIYG